MSLTIRAFNKTPPPAFSFPEGESNTKKRRTESEDAKEESEFNAELEEFCARACLIEDLRSNFLKMPPEAIYAFVKGNGDIEIKKTIIRNDWNKEPDALLEIIRKDFPINAKQDTGAQRRVFNPHYLMKFKMLYNKTPSDVRSTFEKMPQKPRYALVNIIADDEQKIDFIRNHGGKKISEISKLMTEVFGKTQRGRPKREGSLQNRCTITNASTPIPRRIGKGIHTIRPPRPIALTLPLIQEGPPSIHNISPEKEGITTGQLNDWAIRNVLKMREKFLEVPYQRPTQTQKEKLLSVLREFQSLVENTETSQNAPYIAIPSVTIEEESSGDTTDEEENYCLEDQN